MSEFTGNLKNILYDKTGAKPAGPLTYIVWGLISCVLAILITYLFNITGLTENESFQTASDSLMNVSSSVVMLFIMYCFATPFCEEIIFRFVLFGLIYRFSKSAPIAVILTAVLFGLYHMNPVQMLYGFLMGLVITYCYYRYRRLSLAFLMHALANLVGLLYTLL